MRVSTALRRYRAAMDQAMTDTCRILAPGEGERVWNDETGRYEDPAPALVAEGRCIVSTLDTSERVVEVGGEPITLRTLNVDLHPDITGDIRVGQQFALVESANPHLLDRSWHIIDVADGSWSGSRKLTVQEEMPR